MQTTIYTLQRLVLATGGDGPSNPWDAPGMCISYFFLSILTGRRRIRPGSGIGRENIIRKKEPGICPGSLQSKDISVSFYIKKM